LAAAFPPGLVGPAYTRAELDRAQARYGLTFPPDLIDLYLWARIEGGLDWTGDETRIRQALAWPFEGLLAEVEEGGLWWPEWGERPASAGARGEALSAVLQRAPKLIPLYGHRYLPETPTEPGNPVFSVYGSDIIVYGANLAEYLAHEFFANGTGWQVAPYRQIDFWSEMVERSGDPAYSPYAPRD
jgi:hypothetical protein